MPRPLGAPAGDPANRLIRAPLYPRPLPGSEPSTPRVPSHPAGIVAMRETQLQQLASLSQHALATDCRPGRLPKRIPFCDGFVAEVSGLLRVGGQRKGIKRPRVVRSPRQKILLVEDRRPAAKLLGACVYTAAQRQSTARLLRQAGDHYSRLLPRNRTSGRIETKYQTGPTTFELDLILTDSGKGTPAGNIIGTMAFDRKDYEMDSNIPFIKIANRVQVDVDLRWKRISGPAPAFAE